MWMELAKAIIDKKYPRCQIMPLHTDIKYLKFLSARLELFKQKKDHLWNWKCNVCGDSKKKKSKTRAYAYVKKGTLLVMCHNCGYSTTFGKFLHDNDPEMAKQYNLEVFTEKKGKRRGETVPDFRVKQSDIDKARGKKVRLIDDLLDRLDTLPGDHEAVQFVKDRKIPKKMWKELYYIDNVKNMEQLSPRARGKIYGEEPRLVIPFFDRKGMLTGVHCRAMRDEHTRYLSVKVKEDALNIYGLDRWNRKAHTYVVEGPLDSLFLPNCLAVGSADLQKVKMLVDMNNTTFIFDNESRNKDVLKIQQRAINQGFSVVIWPSWLTSKDVNDMVLAGYDVEDLVRENTFRGLDAQNNFNRYRKVVE